MLLDSMPALARIKPGKTQAFNVYERLQADVLHCELLPGTRLLLKDLRVRYGTGLSPLREALMRLVSNGLVVLEDRKGFRVAPVSKEDVIDLTNARCELETITLRTAIEKGDDAWEANVLAKFHELSKRSQFLPDGSRDREWEIRHEAFHRALHMGCNSPWLIMLCGLLFDRSRRYRRLSVQIDLNHRDVAKEHEQIMHAAVSRDVDKALALMKAHISRTTEIILKGWPEIDVQHPHA